MRRARAVRWITAFVDPPIAARARIAFSNASRVRILETEIFSFTSSTMRRPAMRARTYRRASTAGIAALPGMPTPTASIIDAIVDAVPIVMQCPSERPHRELERKATGVEHAVGHVVGEDAEVRVAGSQLGPGVADADHRAAVEHVLRHAAVLHPAAIDEAVDVLASEPLDRALLRVGLFHQ